MGVQVVFHSRTGHSRKLAAAAARALGVGASDIRNFSLKEDTGLLVIVSGIYAGRTDAPLLEFAAGLKGSGLKAALITSAAAGVAEQADLRGALGEAGVEVLSERFVCPGSFLLVRLGRPNEKDRQAAAAYAKRMAEQYAGNGGHPETLG